MPQPTDYMIRIFNTSGELQYVLDMARDIRSLVIEKRLNTPETLTLGIYGLSEAVQYFVLDAIVEVRRRVITSYPAVDWYTEFVGFHRTPQKQITEANNRIFTSYSRGLLDLIKRRSIRYYADTAGSAKGPDKVTNIIRQFVRENAGPSATVANDRLTDGVTSGLTVEPDTGFSLDPSIETANAWQNLLSACQEIGAANNAYFYMEWGGEAAAATFEFKVKWPQQGTNRRVIDPFRFSPQLGNMAAPSFTVSRTEEITSALVLGPGEGLLRDTTLVENAVSQAESPWNLTELDVNASQEDRANALTQIGEQVLYDKRAATNFPFTVIQTPYSMYGVHYFLGDVITASFDDVSSDVMIKHVTLSVSDGAERISLELDEVPPDFPT